jgi:vacuolar-type H+-ATPase subunit I/STV1
MKNTKPFWKVIYILLVAGIVIMLIGAMLGGIKGTRVNINDYNIGIIDSRLCCY